jgi:capsular polysaccharide transport system permease protein
MLPPATLVALRGAAANETRHEAVPAAAADATGLAMTAGGGELAVVHERGIAPKTAARSRRLPLTLLSFLLVVAVPTALATAYYLLIAADQYVAEFRFGLRSSEPIRADTGGLLPGSAAPLQTVIDSYAVAQYIGSRAIVDDLGRTLDLRGMFSTTAADWPARLHLPVTIEALVFYWQRQVDAFFDPINGTIVVRARAFTAPGALALARGILGSSERLVNDLSARARRDAVGNSERDVSAAEHRLTVALAHLRDYRDKEGLIDPHKAADANSALDGRLRDELVRAGTNLSTLQEYLHDDAPTLKILEARILALKAQQSAIESEATDTAKTRNETLSRLMGSYEELESERRFADTAYQHALEALDRARMNADRQQIYIADFVPPSLPEEALYPRRLRAIGIVFIAAFVVWAIGGLTVRSVRDHL